MAVYYFRNNMQISQSFFHMSVIHQQKANVDYCVHNDLGGADI